MSSEEEIRRTIGNEKLVNLLRQVDRELAETDEDHFADDEILLEKWAACSLSADEHEAVLKHLARCDECSQFLHDMIRAGVFVNVAPESDGDDGVDALPMQDSNARRSEQPLSRTRRSRSIIVTIAASVLVVVFGYMIMRNGDSRADTLRLANADCSRLTHYLSEAQFGSIVAIGGKGPKVPDIILPDADRNRELERLAALVRGSTHNTTYHLDYGQLLLEAGKLEAAQEQFLAAISIQPADPYARLGLGISQFRLGQWAAAEQTFGAVADNTPASVSAQVNHVLTLIALDRKDEARQLWKSVPTQFREEKITNVLQAEASE